MQDALLELKAWSLKRRLAKLHDEFVRLDQQLDGLIDRHLDKVMPAPQKPNQDFHEQSNVIPITEGARRKALRDLCNCEDDSEP
ncbi:MAG: hypothetical protein ACYDCC_04770 [Actinomycetota bacterium]